MANKFKQIEDEQKRQEQASEGPLAWLDKKLRPIADLEGGADWFKRQPQKRDYLLMIDDGGKDSGRDPIGVLAAGRVALLASAGGVGKSHALCQLALAVSVAHLQKTKWLGTFEVMKGGRVLLVMGEEEEAEIRRRLYDAARVMGLEERQHVVALENIVPMALAGQTGLALTHSEAERAGKAETPFAEALVERLNASGPWTCIILDPLARFAGGDVEKDNAAATELVQVLEKLSHVAGNPTVVVAHHTRKSQSGGDGSKSADDVRGSSALRDGVRFVAMLEDWERHDNAPRLVTFKVAKNNYGTSPPEIVLARDSDRGGALRRANKQEIEDYNAANAANIAKKATEKSKAEKGRAEKPPDGPKSSAHLMGD